MKVVTIKPELRKYHLRVVDRHNSNMFNELIYDKHIVSDTLKEIMFENNLCDRGYFAKKDRNKYWIQEDIINDLPIKPGNKISELKYKDDIIMFPEDPIFFKVEPKQMYDNFEEFMEDYYNIPHTNLVQFLIKRIISVAGFTTKLFTCIASESSFGKSGSFNYCHGITNMSPTFKPRTVPGLLSQINGTGNIVFDEAINCKKEIRDIMEEFSLDIAGGKSGYNNGALATSKTKAYYQCPNQSIMFLYNVVNNYVDKSSGKVKKYFENMFDNNVAVDRRFLKLKFDGKLSQRFKIDFSIPKEAERFKYYYIGLQKHLLWLTEVIENNEYQQRYKWNKDNVKLDETQRNTYEYILTHFDMVSQTQMQMDILTDKLNNAINNYKHMVQEAEQMEMFK